MAIEGGIVLARRLERHSQDVGLALKTYENLRKDRTTAVVHRSAANLNRFHNAALGNPGLAAAYVEREWEQERVRRRYDWLFEYDATRLPLD